jgi:DNA mismatch repair ATPase MutL
VRRSTVGGGGAWARLPRAPLTLMSSSSLESGEARSAGSDGGLFDTSMLHPAPSRGSSRAMDRASLLSGPPAWAPAPAAGFCIPREALHRLRALGQVERKFIAAADSNSPSGSGGGGSCGGAVEAAAARATGGKLGMLYMIDQHAADERVQLERLLRRTVQPRTGLPVPGGVERVPLQPSVRLSLSAHEQAVVLRHAAKLSAWGWELREPPTPAHRAAAAAAAAAGGAGGAGFGVAPLALEAMPSVQSVRLREPAMLEYALSLEATGGASTLPPPAVHRVLASKACRSAVMFGTPLSAAQCQQILTELAQCDLPFQCAHGRPTITPLLDLSQLPEPSAALSDGTGIVEADVP